MLAIFQHMQSKYGFVPNGIEVMLEPNDVNGWSPTAIGQCLVATAARLQATGFCRARVHRPRDVEHEPAPSYIDGIIAVPGAAALVTEFCLPPVRLVTVRAPADRGTRRAARQAHVDARVLGAELRRELQPLHQDLTIGRNSAPGSRAPFAAQNCRYKHHRRVVERRADRVREHASSSAST